MALICLVSAGGSPGVTTTALGLALGWPSRVLLAECDPGGRSVLPGFMADRLLGRLGPGLLGLTVAGPGSGSVAVDEYVLPLSPDGQAGLLHGVRDPRHAAQLAGVWAPLAAALAGRDGDVLADLGRFGGSDTPVPLLRAADVVVVVMRTTLVQIDAAVPRVEMLTELVGDRARVCVCLIADGAYGAGEVERALGIRALTGLPHSPAEAQVLSAGTQPRIMFRTRGLPPEMWTRFQAATVRLPVVFS